ncbi:SGNH/GDSL hydrolase family protein [Lentzea chajnantorensis]
MTSYAREEADPYCAWPAEADLLVRATPWKRVVVVGDSVAAGIREPLEGYRDLDGTGRVADAFGSSVEYLNLGVRDLRIAEVRATQLEPALEFAPDLAIVAAGGNDVLGRKFDEQYVETELTAVVGPLVAQGAQLAMIGLFDLARSGLVPAEHAPALAERFDRFDALTKRVAQAHGGVQSENHAHPLAADPSIFSSDRIHCNARGHAIAATTLLEALLVLWKRQDEERTA